MGGGPDRSLRMNLFEVWGTAAAPAVSLGRAFAISTVEKDGLQDPAGEWLLLRGIRAGGPATATGNGAEGQGGRQKTQLAQSGHCRKLEKNIF